MINRLVIENLKHRPVRTLLSAVAIGVQVTMILTLVGVSRGVLGDIATRARGTGADILVRPPNSSVLAYSGNMKEGVVRVLREQPHVAQATGTLVQSIGNFNSITGIHLDEFNAISGGFRLIEGTLFQGPNDILVDEIEAKARKLQIGGEVDVGTKWRVCGIVEQGILSRMFTDIRVLQDLYSVNGEVSMIYVKLDTPANTAAVLEALKLKLPTYKIYSVEEFVGLMSVDSIPLLKRFTSVVIGLALVIGFLVVFQSMYTAVLERTREIGILKALGASPGYILGILLREAVVLSVIGAAVGILMTYGARGLMRVFVPTMTQAIVPDWWPWAVLIAVVGALLGALYPGLKAARQDAIEALAYD